MSGCVYLRLLEFKNQLADFDKNFGVSTENGVHLIFRHPVLQGDDLRWLGAEPLEIAKKEDSPNESWHVRWVKQIGPDVHETTEHDVELFAELQDHELQSLRIPERYFEFFPKSLFVDLLRSTGKARINKESRQAEVSATGATPSRQPIAPPELGAIEKLLGEPTEKVADSSGLMRFRYRYQAQIPSGKGKFIEATFFFDKESGQLRRLVGKLPKGTMSFNFPAQK